MEKLEGDSEGWTLADSNMTGLFYLNLWGLFCSSSNSGNRAGSNLSSFSSSFPSLELMVIKSRFLF